MSLAFWPNLCLSRCLCIIAARLLAVESFFAQYAKIFSPDKGSQNRRTLKWIVIEKIPFVALAVISSVITFLVQRAGGAMIEVNALPLYYRVSNAFISYVKIHRQNVLAAEPGSVLSFRCRQIRILADCIRCSVLLLLFQSLFFGLGGVRNICLVGWFWFVRNTATCYRHYPGRRAGHGRPLHLYTIYRFVHNNCVGLPDLSLKWPYRKNRSLAQPCLLC